MSKSFGRKNTPRGQMSSGGGPAIMMMQPAIRAMFMPNPPLKFIAKPVMAKTAHKLTGMGAYMSEFSKDDKSKDIPKISSRKKERYEKRTKVHRDSIAPRIESYRAAASASEGVCDGMNCYNTIFVGRLAYEVSERKLLREFEHYGPVKDVKLVRDKEEKSRGYAFVEFEKEDDMRRAYRAADGMRIEGRQIVVDVERGHTVPNWLPRRLGGGLGGTRIGEKHLNVHVPGRWDPAMAEMATSLRGPPPPLSSTGGYGHPPPISPPSSSRYDRRDSRDRGGGYGGRDRRDNGYGYSSQRPGDKRRRSRSRSRERARPRW